MFLLCSLGLGNQKERTPTNYLVLMPGSRDGGDGSNAKQALAMPSNNNNEDNKSIIIYISIRQQKSPLPIAKLVRSGVQSFFHKYCVNMLRFLIEVKAC